MSVRVPSTRALGIAPTCGDNRLWERDVLLVLRKVTAVLTRGILPNHSAIGLLYVASAIGNEELDR